MARRVYRLWSTATGVLTAAPALIASGTTIKTIQQVKPSVHTPVIGYGYRLETAPVAAIKLEVLTTGTVNATVVASVAGDVSNFDPLGPASTLTLATSGTGYNASAEGTISASRLFDFVTIPVGGEYRGDFQFPLDREYACGPAHYLRLRVTTATTINLLSYFDLEE